MIDIVKNQNKNKKKVKVLIEFVKDNGGIEYTTARMKEYQEQALKILDSLEESPAKESLITLVNYVINRNI
jgi:octaprenyl-diphosphate synthase